jgi:hypothetical protein
MAKRLKLGKFELIQNAPEVEKLRDLNEEMSQVLKTKKEPLEASKIQQYQELLAEYKQVMDAFARTQSKKLNVDENDVKDSIAALLEKRGVFFKERKVHFPLDKISRQRWRKSTGCYSRRSFEDAVRFLTAKQPEKPNRNTKKMAEKVYQYLKNDFNFDNYPNARGLLPVPKFNGTWVRL